MTIDSRNKELILAALTNYFNMQLSMAEQLKSFNMHASAAKSYDTANQISKLIDEVAEV